MGDTLRRESIYLWYYFTILIDQIAPYWVVGILIGSIISVIGKDKILMLVDSLRVHNIGLFGIVPASILGIASPLCMYGTIPVAATCASKGLREDWLAAFMMSSILLNPQLLVYSAALGKTVLIIRIGASIVLGVAAGLLVNLFFKGKKFFNFYDLEATVNRDTDPSVFVRLIKNIWRNVIFTGPYFLAGIVLTMLFQRYVPTDSFAHLFGNHRGFGVLMAATLGVPLYLCGGGTIPILVDWLARGMTIGAATAFMVTGPATKLTNLGAIKIVLGGKNFVYYILFSVCSALILGFLVNVV